MNALNALPPLTTRPWWLSHAIATKKGVVVARAHIGGGRMIDLTSAELAELGQTPGVMVWPEIVNGPRPSTNREESAVTPEMASHALDLLQSEGHCDDRDVQDRTPWQKGDLDD